MYYKGKFKYCIYFSHLVTYALYDSIGHRLSYHDLQDKGQWCVNGASQEETFVSSFGKQLGVRINPEKRVNKYAVDLIDNNGTLADLKVQNTPFFKAKSLFGKDPQFCVVFNKKDKERYERYYPNCNIYFWVDWIATFYDSDTEHPNSQKINVKPMKGVWQIEFQDLLKIINKSPLHEYLQRRCDNNGNAKSSYILNLQEKEFKKLI